MATTTPVDRTLHLAGERAPFAMLPRWLLYHPDVGEGAKFLYCVLHDLVSGRQGPTRPVTRAELAICCGVSVDTIDRRLAQLVSVGAVEKQAQIRAGGQQANVYLVWLTPPEGLQRGIDKEDSSGGRKRAAPVEGGAISQVSRSRKVAAPTSEPHGCGPAGRRDAAPNEKEEEKRTPPQPPRPAGGQHELSFDTPAPAGRRRSRAAGTNPRADADREEAARLEAEVAARQAELDRANAARRAADVAAQAEADRLEAEALAVSAALDDRQLGAVVDLVTERMAGPLARSPLAISRAVVAWCRTAVAAEPGPLSVAVALGLSSRLAAGEGSAPVDLPPAPAGTAPLRHRIAALRTPAAVG